MNKQSVASDEKDNKIQALREEIYESEKKNRNQINVSFKIRKRKTISRNRR